MSHCSSCSTHHPKETKNMVIDPICGMTVDPQTALFEDYKGTRYFFCSKNCQTKFKTSPEKYLENDSSMPPSPITTGSEGEIYTCPMHPEIRQKGPGSCPLCGMALEPLEISLTQDQEDSEYPSMLRRFWVSVALSIPVVIVAMSEMIPGFEQMANSKYSSWGQIALATPVVFWGGWPFFERGWTSIKNKSLNMFTLISIGIGSAYGFSIVATLFPHFFPESIRVHGHIPVYFEAATVITTLVLLGQVLELRARSRTNSAIKALLHLTPKTARLVQNGIDLDIPIEQIHIGDLLRVRPGEKIPVDGIIVDGKSFIDESMVTGEPTPIDKKPGDRATAGTLNENGSFVMRADRVGKDTLLAQIVKLVAEAQRTKAPIQRLADITSSYFVPIVILVSIGTAALWAVIGPEPRLAHALVNAIAVLIIACPCALGLATPISIMVGTGRGAQAGLLFKNAEALETLEKINTLVVDKTGTLTEGKPRLISITQFSPFTELELLRLAASVEQASEHPLARAIVTAAREKNITLSPVSEFHAVTGQGVMGQVENHKIQLGNSIFLPAINNELKQIAESLRQDGSTVITAIIDGKPAGYLSIADAIKESTIEALQSLRADGIEIVMMTGDNLTTAMLVAKKLNITEVHAEVMPADKANIVKQLQTKGRIVAMAGDGVNDAPALAQAHVGIAMGSGTDVAIQSAGITLIKSDLLSLVRAKKLSRATMKNIRQNLFFAFFYNMLGVPIAAGALYPIFGLLLSPMIAAAAMTFSSVSVISNALRLRNVKL